MSWSTYNYSTPILLLTCLCSVENKKLEIQQKLDDAEARRLELLEEEKKWRQDKRRLKRVCKYCECEIRSKDYLISHLTSKQHKAALKKLNLDEAAANQDCIITIPLYPGKSNRLVLEVIVLIFLWCSWQGNWTVEWWGAS